VRPQAQATSASHDSVMSHEFSIISRLWSCIPTISKTLVYIAVLVVLPKGNVASQAPRPSNAGQALAPAKTSHAPESYERLYLGTELKSQKDLQHALESYIGVGNVERNIVLSVLTSDMDNVVQDYCVQTAKNWMFHLKNVGRANHVLLIGAEPMVCMRLWNESIPCYVDMMSSRGLKGIQDEGVKQVPNGVQGVLKWFFSDQLINLGYNVLYMDTDSVALRDPFHEFVESDGYEFMAMSEQDTSPYNRRMDVLERKCPMFDFGGVDVYEEPVKLCASTRVFFLRATESTKILTKAMLAAMNGNTKENTWWEAKLVQKVALVYAWAEGWTPGLRIKILDLAKYCTVKVLDLRIQAKQSVTDVVVLHSGAIAIKDRPLALSHVHQWDPDAWTIKVASAGHVTEDGWWQRGRGVNFAPYWIAGHTPHHVQVKEQILDESTQLSDGGVVSSSSPYRHTAMYPGAPLPGVQNSDISANNIEHDTNRKFLLQSRHKRNVPWPNPPLPPPAIPPPMSVVVAGERMWK